MDEYDSEKLASAARNLEEINQKLDNIAELLLRVLTLLRGNHAG